MHNHVALTNSRKTHFFLECIQSCIHSSLPPSSHQSKRQDFLPLRYCEGRVTARVRARQSSYHCQSRSLPGEQTGDTARSLTEAFRHTNPPPTQPQHTHTHSNPNRLTNTHARLVTDPFTCSPAAAGCPFPACLLCLLHLSRTCVVFLQQKEDPSKLHSPFAERWREPVCADAPQ